jgi:hypothetical protein
MFSKSKWKLFILILFSIISLIIAEGQTSSSAPDKRRIGPLIFSTLIENRIKMNNFHFDFENIKYGNAGHLISSNPNNPSSMRQGKMEIEGKSYDFNFGGTETGDMEAQKDAAQRVFKFLSKLEND